MRLLTHEQIQWAAGLQSAADKLPFHEAREGLYSPAYEMPVDREPTVCCPDTMTWRSNSAPVPNTPVMLTPWGTALGTGR
jgi:hypothetical protein